MHPQAFFLLAVMSIRSFISGFVLKQSSLSSSSRSGDRSLSMVASASSLFDRKRYSSSSSEGKEVLDPLVICGPSGVGKGTIIEKFMKEYNGHERFGFSVSHTTRQPREGEMDGVHYHFVSKETFSDSSRFVEWAEVHGNFYGTSWTSLQTVQSNGKKVLLDIDVQGVQRLKTIRSKDGNDNDQQEDTSDDSNTLFLPRFVFIAPPSLETLQERLIARGTESAESMQRRLANSKAEVEYGLEAGNFDAIIVNDDLARAAQELSETIERMYNYNQ